MRRCSAGGCEPKFDGRGGRRGLEMDPLSSPMATSYGFPIVTIGPSLTVLAELRLLTDGQTDGRNWSSKRRQCTKVQSAVRPKLFPLN